MIRKQVQLLLALVVLVIIPTYAQISINAIPKSFVEGVNLSKRALPTESMPNIDIDVIQEEDFEEEQAGLPPRFGYPFEVNFTLKNSGQWETLANGDRIWRLKIEAIGAKSINLLYEDFFIPKSAYLHLYNSETDQIIGAFSHLNNKSNGQFATGLIYGEQTILEYYEPANVKGQGRINISTVVHGYRYIPNPKTPKAYGDSGDCNINTICEEGDDWRDEIKAIGLMVINGTRWCSGALYGNTNMDCTPLFVTANHCLSSFDAVSNPDANTISFIWRYESPNCTPNGGTGNDGPTNMTTVGATVLANNGNPGNVEDSDFAVLELAESPIDLTPDIPDDIYYLGWDAASTSHSSATGIHHPAGDVKKISMENDALTSTNYSNDRTVANGTHWRVADWDSGTTEGGSSGSPLLNSTTKRVIGHLSGGGAACGNNQSDWYGQTLDSWDNNGVTDARRRMQDWLDFTNTGMTAIDGYYPVDCPIPSCDDGIKNNGETAIDCGGPNCDPCPCETTVTLTLTFDNYPEETSWELKNQSDVLIASGGPYNTEPDGATIMETICVDLECFTFSLIDSYGDGICCDYGEGAYTLINDLDGSTIASGASFGSADETDFCIDGVSLGINVMLQGTYNNDGMKTELNTNAEVPELSPYGDGATTTEVVISTYDIVDWVEVQLRSTTAPYPILAKRGALLKSNGKVVHTDGYTDVIFPEVIYDGIVDGDYRIAIQHRNHLGIMTNTDYTLD